MRIMNRMLTASHPRAAILRRLTQLEEELRQSRVELKNLRTHDPATAVVVMRVRNSAASGRCWSGNSNCSAAMPAWPRIFRTNRRNSIQGKVDMEAAKIEERLLLTQQLEVVRAKLRETGATVLSPTAEWTALRKKMLALTKQLK